MSAADVSTFRGCGCSDAEIAAYAGEPGPCWGFAPALPSKPGLYVVMAFCGAPRPLLLTWSRHSREWRHGARVERVDAFYGPITLPTRNPEHADVEHLFGAAPTHPPASRARASGTDRSNRR